MHIQNPTSLTFGWLVAKVKPPAYSLTLVVKGTFALTHGEVASPVGEADRRELQGDTWRGDDTSAGLLYASDYAPWKPRADVLARGTCHAPRGQPLSSCRVALHVGSWQKALTAAPELGPLDGRSKERLALMGNYDDRWLKERWPWFPGDFDWGYFNAAPRDQQIQGYLRGDEALAFENMHPEHPRFTARLPGVRPRCLVQSDTGLRDVDLALDTLWVDMDAARLVLVWRGLTPVRALDPEEIQTVLIAEERLDEPKLPAEEIWSHHVGRQAPSPAEEAAEEAQRARAEAEKPIDETSAADPEMAQALKDMRALLEKARVAPKLLQAIDNAKNVDEVLSLLIAEIDVDPAAAERVEKEARDKARKLLTDHGMDPSILDDDEPNAKGAPEPHRPLTKEEVAQRAARGESCAGADLTHLDLSHCDVRGLDLSGANLTGVKLVGADLSGANLLRACLRRADLRGAKLARVIAHHADLSSAELAGADLSGASLEAAGFTGAGLNGANLDGADLTGAILAGADLQRASFAFATLEGADLSHAVLTGANGPRAQLNGALLNGVDLREAVLDGANLQGCLLDGVNLERASLKGAFLYGARGEGLRACGADLTKLKCGDGASFLGGDFKQVRGEGSIWSNTILTGADFSGAALTGAIFDKANLQGSNFHRAALEHASLMGAKLSGARLSKVNLFQGSLDHADLTDVDLQRSNLYGCGFLEAILTRIKLDGANLKSTEIAARGLVR